MRAVKPDVSDTNAEVSPSIVNTARVDRQDCRVLIVSYGISSRTSEAAMNLLRDEELVSLIAQSGGKWIFMGLESIDPENLKSVRKTFNKPEEYKEILETIGMSEESLSDTVKQNLVRWTEELIQNKFADPGPANQNKADN